MRWWSRLKELLWTGEPDEDRAVVVLEAMERQYPFPRAPRRLDGLFATKGEVIVCEGIEQHYIATAARDIKFAQFPQNPAEDFTAWLPGLPPPLGTAPADVPRCPSCGARWWAGAFHFKDGWR